MTESLIFAPSGSFNEPEDDDNATIRSSSQQSLAARTIMLSIEDLFELWKMKEKCNFDFKLTHSASVDEVIIKISISKINFAAFPQPDLPPQPVDSIEDDLLVEIENLKRQKDLATTVEKQRIACQICNMSFESLSALKNHEQGHARYFEIAHRSSRSTYKVDDEIHPQIHETVKFETYEVSSDDEIDQQATKLLIPLRVNVDMDNYEFYEMVGSDTSIDSSSEISEPPMKLKMTSQSCQYCSKLYKHAKSLEKHEERHRAGTIIDQKCSCQICGKHFLRRYSLKLHMQRHNDDPKQRKFTILSCDMCSHVCKNKNALAGHMRKMHTLNNKCDLCGKRFMRNELLRIHVDSVHLKKKDFCCHLCGNSFTYQSSFSKHLRVHTGEKNFVCDICGHRTFSKDKIRRHMGSHVKFAQFQCDDCGKMFRGLDKVRDHKKLMHLGGQRTASGKRLKCLLCRKEFKMLWNVKEHMQGVHKLQRKITAAEIYEFSEAN